MFDNVVKVYVNLINNNKITINEVPDKYDLKEQVTQILNGKKG